MPLTGSVRGRSVPDLDQVHAGAVRSASANNVLSLSLSVYCQTLMWMLFTAGSTGCLVSWSSQSLLTVRLLYTLLYSAVVVPASLPTCTLRFRSTVSSFTVKMVVPSATPVAFAKVFCSFSALAFLRNSR